MSAKLLPVSRFSAPQPLTQKRIPDGIYRLTFILFGLLAACSPNNERKGYASVMMNDSVQVGLAGADIVQDDADMVTKVPEVLEIHHINVKHGDATLILLKDSLDKVKDITLIDGGDHLFFKDNGKKIGDEYQYNPIWYLCNEEIFQCDFDSLLFMGTTINRLIISHFDTDHYRGIKDFLLIYGLKFNEVIYPGGFINNRKTNNLGTHTPGKSDTLPYVNGLKDTESLQALALNIFGHPKAPKITPVSRLANNRTITLGKVNGVDVTMELIAYVGWVKGKNTRMLGSDITSANNYSLAWVLEYGEFRYFTGGDLGGYSGSYVDHETSVANLLKSMFKKDAAYDDNVPHNRMVTEYDGHICAIKTNHHGSEESNNTEFLNTTAPAVMVTSVGTKHKLPAEEAMKRMAKTDMSPAKQNRGIYFTNLNGGYPDKVTVAKNLFVDDSLNYNGHIVIYVDNPNIATESTFDVALWDISGQYNLSQITYHCHK